MAGAYKDWAALGCGCRNFMAFGEFPEVGGERDITKRWLKPGVLLDGKLDTVHPFDAGKIAEHVRHSWYEGEEARAPYDGETKPAFTRMGDTDRYSWLKAPRYDGLAMETGPLAQMLVAYAQGHEAVKPAVDKVLSALGVGPEALFSTLGRTAARGVETLVIAQQVEKWLAEYEANIAGGDKKIAMECSVPREGRGVGFVNAPRGGLSHWLRIEDGKIGNFQLVVPTTWNLGPRDAKHVLSAAEQALVGTPVADPKRPVEILRTIHSFDPCIACAVHVIDGETNQVHEFKVLKSVSVRWGKGCPQGALPLFHAPSAGTAAIQGGSMSETVAAPRVLIMGVGNILLRDEGFGVAAVNHLEKNYYWPENVRLQEGATQGLLLMSELEECDLLVVLDVVLGGKEPGTVYLLENEDLSRSLSFQGSMHQTDLLQTLQVCELAGCRPQCLAFGLQPFDWRTMQVGLSPEAEAMLPVFAEKVVAELVRRGIVARRKETA